jgi:two-component system, chemotaxis family, protein-glutamate methylesterase/glutaminase
MIVIGGSLGGAEALNKILRRLPVDFAWPIVVVLHRHRDSEGMLVPMVQRGCALPVVEPEDKDPIEAGRVYLCPPDYHLMLDEDCFMLSTDDPINFARPSIDALFESAAEWRCKRVVAVVLSGAGSDGSAGARRVKERGGIVVVQDPATAEGTWMPAAALAATQTRHVLTLEQIAATLIRMARHHSHWRAKPDDPRRRED